MENLQQRILKGANIFKNIFLVFLFICLISSIVSIYAIPFLVNNSITEKEINQGINQVGMTYGGTLPFSANEIISSIVPLFRLSVLSMILVIIAYIVKYRIDKKMFRANRWRDWKFFLYVSGISLIIVDIFQKITISNGDNFIVDLILTIFSCFIMVIFSSIILPGELEEIKI